MSEEQALREDELVTVAKNDIIPGLQLPSDVFMKLSDRYVLVAKKGAKSSLHDLHAAENDANLLFYVRRSEFAACVEQNVRIGVILARNADLPLERRAEFLKLSLDSVFKQIDEMGFRPELVEHGRALVGALTAMIGRKEDYLKMMSVLNDLPGDIVREAIAGAGVSVLIGRNLGWHSTNLEKLALGALLRDVGLKRIPAEILAKKRSEMSASERAAWEQHPYHSAEILRGLPNMPLEAVAVALEHHENAMGLGFPRRARDFSMHAHAKIVSLADAFVDLTLQRGDLFARTPEEAIYHIDFTLGMPYNRSCMLALRKAFDFKI